MPLLMAISIGGRWLDCAAFRLIIFRRELNANVTQ